MLGRVGVMITLTITLVSHLQPNATTELPWHVWLMYRACCRHNVSTLMQNISITLNQTYRGPN